MSLTTCDDTIFVCVCGGGIVSGDWTEVGGAGQLELLVGGAFTRVDSGGLQNEPADGSALLPFHCQNVLRGSYDALWNQYILTAKHC